MVRVVDHLDYTPGGLDWSDDAADDIGATDEIHGEGGDDAIYGQVGGDILLGDAGDDDIIGLAYTKDLIRVEREGRGDMSVLDLVRPVDAQVAKWTTNSGGSWQPSSFQEKRNDAPFYVYGTYTTSGSSPVETERYFVRSVGISLQVGSESYNRVDTAVDLLNAPEVMDGGT